VDRNIWYRDICDLVERKFGLQHYTHDDVARLDQPHNLGSNGIFRHQFTTKEGSLCVVEKYSISEEEWCFYSEGYDYLSACTPAHFGFGLDGAIYLAYGGVPVGWELVRERPKRIGELMAQVARIPLKGAIRTVRTNLSVPRIERFRDAVQGAPHVRISDEKRILHALLKRTSRLNSSLDALQTTCAHRDFKPANLVFGDGEIMLIDWGQFGGALIGHDFKELLDFDAEGRLQGRDFLEVAIESFRDHLANCVTRHDVLLSASASRIAWATDWYLRRPDEEFYRVCIHAARFLLDSAP
jgi:hypothetical protein